MIIKLLLEMETAGILIQQLIYYIFNSWYYSGHYEIILFFFLGFIDKVTFFFDFLLLEFQLSLLKKLTTLGIFA